MGITQVRHIINDRPQFAEYQTVGDGVRTRFALPNSPVVPASESVLAGIPFTDPTNYSLDDATGTITFTVPPPSGVIILVTYQWTILDDAELQTFIDLEGEDRFAAAMALETIATNQALTLKVIRIMNVQADGDRVAKAIREHAKILRSEAGADFDWAEMVLDQFTFMDRLHNQFLREN